MPPNDEATLYQDMSDMIAKLQFQLAALQAEAARVVGLYLEREERDYLGTTDQFPENVAARSFLSALPSPAVVARDEYSTTEPRNATPDPAVVVVPVEPGEGDIEAMAEQHHENSIYASGQWKDWSASSQVALRRAMTAAYRALVKRHGG